MVGGCFWTGNLELGPTVVWDWMTISCCDLSFWKDGHKIGQGEGREVRSEDSLQGESPIYDLSGAK